MPHVRVPEHEGVTATARDGVDPFSREEHARWDRNLLALMDRINPKAAERERRRSAKQRARRAEQDAQRRSYGDP